MARYETNRGLFHGLNYQIYSTAAPIQRLVMLSPAQEHILTQELEKAAEIFWNRSKCFVRGWVA